MCGGSGGGGGGRRRWCRYICVRDSLYVCGWGWGGGYFLSVWWGGGGEGGVDMYKRYCVCVVAVGVG